MIQQLKAHYPVKTLCAALDCPVSTAYYVSMTNEATDVLVAAEQVLLRFPFYGYRKLSKALTRQGYAVGEHVARRLLQQLGMSRSVGKVRVQTTNSNHPHPRYPNRIKGMTLKSPDQVWVADITYIRLGKRFIYLAVILDAYSRAVRGWSLSRSLSQDLTLNALDMALASGRCPFIFHSDQGSQYAAWLHTDRLLENHILISMSDKASPQQNGIVERFMRTVKEEHIDYSEYQDFDDAYRQLKHWLEVTYMTERLHQSLEYVTPAEFELAALAQPRYPLLSPV
jgi:transposase InsO family protein